MTQLHEDLFFEDDDAAIGAAELTKKTLIDTQERMGMMLDLMPTGLLIHTAQGIIFANQEACRLLQVTQKQAVGHHFLDFVDAAEIEPVSRHFANSFTHAAALTNRDMRITRSDGSEVHIKLISSRLPWQGNPVLQVLLQDVTDLKRTEQTLRRMTVTDELTGAFNRRHAFYEAALYIDPERLPRIPLSAVMLDVDHFKLINDTHGHAIGDQTLKQLTRVANDVIRTGHHVDSAMFARIGGEEFLVLLPGAGLDEAVELSERLRRAVEAMLIDSPAGPLSCTVSLGVAAFIEEDVTFDALLSRCDTALYEAKAAGRNCIKLG